MRVAPLQQDICLWRFKAPIAPHIAAQKEGVALSVRALTSFCDERLFLGFEYMLIEGAGGLMVPLNQQDTWIDFLEHSQIPVLLVIGMRVGCINHALLTALALKTHRITCVGWVANCIEENMLVVEENIATLKEKIDWPLLGVIPYQGTFEAGLAKNII